MRHTFGGIRRYLSDLAESNQVWKCELSFMCAAGGKREAWSKGGRFKLDGGRLLLVADFAGVDRHVPERRQLPVYLAVIN